MALSLLWLFESSCQDTENCPPTDGDIERDEDRYRYGDTATKSCIYSHKKI